MPSAKQKSRCGPGPGKRLQGDRCVSPPPTPCPGLAPRSRGKGEGSRRLQRTGFLMRPRRLPHPCRSTSCGRSRFPGGGFQPLSKPLGRGSHSPQKWMPGLSPNLRQATEARKEGSLITRKMAHSGLRPSPLLSWEVPNDLVMSLTAATAPDLWLLKPSFVKRTGTALKCLECGRARPPGPSLGQRGLPTDLTGPFFHCLPISRASVHALLTLPGTPPRCHP